MQPLVEHRPVLAGIRTRALELEGSGPPVVLLHGYADSADTWRLVLDRLARSGRAAVAFDLPGFGRAGPLRPGSVLAQLDAFTAAAVRRAYAEHGTAPVLAGNSLGGCLALRAAQDRALPLAGIVPVAPAGLDMPRWFQVIERDLVLRTLLSLPTPVPERLLRALVGELYRRLAFHRPRAIDVAIVDAFTGHLRSRRAVASYLATGRRLLPELSDPFALHLIDCAVLLVWGRRDRMVAASGAQRVLAALPGTEHVVLPDCGHCPQLEAPGALTDVLEDFLQRVEGGSLPSANSCAAPS